MKPAFPRIGIFNNELVASTEKGLFICNTDNLKSRYIQCAGANNKGTTSIAVMDDAVVSYGDGAWFLYRGGQLKRIKLYGDSTGYIATNSSTLNVNTINHTAYVLSNPASVIAQMSLKGDSLLLEKKIFTGDFINTVTTDAEKVWVNTIHKSYLLNSPDDRLEGYDFTSIVTDKEGNTWYSSLKNGLMVKYRTLPGSLQPINILQGDDRVNCIQQKGPLLVLGTQNGNIILFDPQENKVLKKITLPVNRGMITYLFNIDGNRFLVGTSVNTYEVDIEKNTFKLYTEIKSLKEVDKSDRYLFMASAGGLIVSPLNTRETFRQKRAAGFKAFTYKQGINGDYLYYKMRCRAVCYDQANKLVFVAFKDGLYIIDKQGFKPFFYNNESIYAMCLKYVNGKVLIGSINKGLLITDGKTIKQLTVNDGLASNTVIRIKKTGDNLWLMGASATTVLDIANFKVINSMDLSSLDETQVLDLAVIKNSAYVATADGFNFFETSKLADRFNITNYLQGVYINDKPKALNRTHAFRYFENNLQFNLAVPFYYHSHDIYFKYLLSGTNNKNWQTTQPGERNISFSELSPGKYKLKAYAVHPQIGRAIIPVVYEFSIAEQWWQTWPAKIFMTLFIAALVTYIVANYLLNRLRSQKSSYEQQLTIETERQRISSEMHDDVGAGLSAIKLFLNMAKNNREPADITHISDMINDMAEKINEIIWSTNTENDSLASLIDHIEYQSQKLFRHSEINLKVSIPIETPVYVITSENRRNIYLVTKEMLHNALKHSKATTINLENTS